MWHRQLDWIEPFEAALRCAGESRVCLLDSAMRHADLGRFSYLAFDPFGVFQSEGDHAFWNGRRESEMPLEALRRRLASCSLRKDPDLPPFQGGAMGVLAYELGWSLDHRSSPTRSSSPDIDLAFYDCVVAFDHETQRCWAIASGLPEVAPADRKARALGRLDAFCSQVTREASRTLPRLPIGFRPTLSRNAYRAAVHRVQAYIRSGDIYQANIAQRFRATLPHGATGLGLYAQLRAANPAPFAAYLDCGPRQILSSSPELFLRCDGARVETRPIKGTARRSEDPREDDAVAAALSVSRKDRAENVMIVDLLRNDLSRVCDPHSIDVPTLCGIESYAGVHHLVSAVTGTLRPDADALDLLAASFPGGSITGAPKRRAMEIIAEIEGVSRGAYCGAFGTLGFDGSMDLAIAIRTMILENGAVDLRAGGGITLLSDADAEYEETLVKARRIFSAFAIEAESHEAVA